MFTAFFHFLDDQDASFDPHDPLKSGCTHQPRPRPSERSILGQGDLQLSRLCVVLGTRFVYDGAITDNLLLPSFTTRTKLPLQGYITRHHPSFHHCHPIFDYVSTQGNSRSQPLISPSRYQDRQRTWPLPCITSTSST